VASLAAFLLAHERQFVARAGTMLLGEEDLLRAEILQDVVFDLLVEPRDPEDMLGLGLAAGPQILFALLQVGIGRGE